MSRFARCAAIASSVLAAGCLRIESSGSDPAGAPDAFVPGTSLDGAISCGSMQCSSGTLCAHWSSGIDAAVPGNNTGCVIVPASCRVEDCGQFTYYGCPQCIYDLCSTTSTGAGVSLDARDLYCPGV